MIKVEDHTLIVDVNVIQNVASIDTFVMGTRRGDGHSPLTVNCGNAPTDAKIRPTQDDKTVNSLQMYVGEKVGDDYQEDKDRRYKINSYG